MLSSYLTSGRARHNAPAVYSFVPASLYVALVAGIGLLSGSCNSATTPNGGRIKSIELTPASLALTPGTARAVDARVLDASGSPMAGMQVFWAAEDPNIATVSSQGIVTAVAPGRTLVAASRGGVSAVAPVTVSALPPALVRVTPTTSTVNVGATTILIADVLDTGGGKMTGYTVTWTSDRPANATVNSSGTVTGVSAGTAVITATAAGLSGTAVVTVRLAPVATVAVAPATGTVQVGKTMQLAVTLRDANGTALTGRSVTWSSGSITIAAVLPSGLVTGLRKGTAKITATSEGRSGSSTITVR